MKHIPNFITSLNLASGFVAVIFLFSGDPVPACWLLLAAMVFDFFDGFASRLLNAYSDVGKELDSLADLVSFGVAPGIIVYTLLSGTIDYPVTGLLYDRLSLLFIGVSVIMPVCAGLRLAKFNTDTTQKTSFKGLPTPANALAVISVVLAGKYGNSSLTDWFLSNHYAIILYSLALSGLMVTRIPLLSLKFSSFRIRENLTRYILVLICVLIIAATGLGGIIFIIPAYIAVSVISEIL